MSLVHRHPVSEAQLAANRRNALAPGGPRTARGKAFIRFNAAKHWGRAEAYRRFMPALDEDPAEFERLRQAFYDSLEPRDGFEAALVDDMVEIRWRLRRMIRAEAAVQAKQRRLYKAELDQHVAAHEGPGDLRIGERELAAQVGFVGLHDSPRKFKRIIDFLETLALLVHEGGFLPEHLICLKTVYGPHPGTKGTSLIFSYRDASEHPLADPERETKRREAFVRELEEQIDWFRKRAELDRQARAQVAPARVDAELLSARLDPQKVMYYQEGLERRLERKWKQIERYRKIRRREAALEPVTIEAEAAPGQHLDPVPASGSEE